MGVNWKFCCAFVLTVWSFALPAQTVSKQLNKIRLEGPAQGTQFHISYFAADSLVKRDEIDSILNLIDLSMSIYRNDSKISTFNQDSVMHIDMDVHLAKVIAASFRYHKLSDGQFDITIAPLVNLWGFGVNKGQGIPDSALVMKTKELVGMQYLKVRGNRLFKKKAGVKIDVNGIAQGYTVDVLADYLQRKGISRYMVEVGGEIRTLGSPPGQHGFTIGIVQPGENKVDQVMTAVVQLQLGAITTAGSFEKFIKYKNKKLGHHLDPMTGFPYRTNVLSVTVYAKTAMDADALDNFLMGQEPEQIIARTKALKNVEVFVIYQNKDQSVQTIYSDGFSKLFKN
ncbi:FAD:protein FMN transferase [Sphingobacterium sp. N143]|uniref:FAD:protein FMN transferase n=1 Tax=Sphingobacterium sp. N143 TaxID=2746727 RepID=UPI00257644F6|nr:FAD:protein FMN transferase [Sphingobacterium sp. N143]MDM1293116.1 FAD:protein FMN transferase [Sphingobacterium sp. N143]